MTVAGPLSPIAHVRYGIERAGPLRREEMEATKELRRKADALSRLTVRNSSAAAEVLAEILGDARVRYSTRAAICNGRLKSIDPMLVLEAARAALDRPAAVWDATR